MQTQQPRVRTESQGTGESPGDSGMERSLRRSRDVSGFQLRGSHRQETHEERVRNLWKGAHVEGNQKRLGPGETLTNVAPAFPLTSSNLLLSPSNIT